jgi:hypothetical protein
MQVTRLSTTPIKGLALHHPTSIDVAEGGAVGDRAFFLIDERGGLVSIAKTGSLVGLTATFDPQSQRLLIMDGDECCVDGSIELGEPCLANFFGYRDVAGHFVDGPWNEVLSARAGRPLRLVKATDPLGGRDVEPLSLLGQGSIHELAQQSGIASVDSRRFRMLIEFDGAAAHAEDSWHGRHLRIGTAVIAVGGPVQRCAGTTRNPQTGSVDLRTLELIGAYRGRQESIFGLGFNFGVYGRCVEAGRISLGDPLHLDG